jgi:hypothetical protein
LPLGHARARLRAEAEGKPMIVPLALLLALPAQDPAGALLDGAKVQVLDVKKGSYRERGTLLKARMEGRCTLMLQTDIARFERIRAPAGALRMVQGDDLAMIEISTNQAPEQSVIFAVGEAKYAPAITMLTKLAQRCGAKLVGPPPLVMVPRP